MTITNVRIDKAPSGSHINIVDVTNSRSEKPEIKGETAVVKQLQNNNTVRRHKKHKVSIKIIKMQSESLKIVKQNHTAVR